MNFSRSELARLSSKKLVPNVCERAHEYETRVEPRTDPSSSGHSVFERMQANSKSMDNTGKFFSHRVGGVLYCRSHIPYAFSVLIYDMFFFSTND